GTGESSGGSAHGSVFIIWDESFPASPWPAGYAFDAAAPPLGETTRIDGMGGSSAPANVRFGEELVVGEFSGDGFPDLFVGDLLGDTDDPVPPPKNRSNRAGIGVIIYNVANLRGQSIDLTSPPVGLPYTVTYGPIGAAIGADTAVVADFDGDGIEDLAIGNPCDDAAARAEAGSIHVLYGQPGGWPALVDQSLANLPGPEVMRIARIDGAVVGDTLCYSATAGDMDGDGFMDLITNEMKGEGFEGTPSNVGNVLVIEAGAFLPAFVPRLGFSPSATVDFGGRDLGATAHEIDITVSNVSGAVVSISSLGITGPAAASFSVVSGGSLSSLAAGESQVVRVRFTPAVTGCFGAALSMSTGPLDHPEGVGLRGTGIDASLAPRIVQFARLGADAVIRFRSQKGYIYRLRRSPDMVAWSTIQTGIAGTGSVVPLFDQSPPANPDTFYLVIGEPAP
ncbi:MAG: choice-of-anchor D domain-containing protein, partial [Verrucomicrobiales bacterium]